MTYVRSSYETMKKFRQVWVTLGSTISIKTLIKLLIPSVRKKFHIEWMLLGFFGIGISKLPKRVSQRLYTLTWLSAGYVVMQGYSSSLIGFFASPGQYKPIQNLEELEKSDIVIAGLQNMKDQLSITYPRIARDFKVRPTLYHTGTCSDTFGQVRSVSTSLTGISASRFCRNSSIC